jgi:hypothetical protein
VKNFLSKDGGCAKLLPTLYNWGEKMFEEVRVFKELGFVYIVKGRKFLRKKDAEEYAKERGDLENGNDR